jgi:hypothetical protein
MYCSNCGFKLPKTHQNYCLGCGVEVAAPVGRNNAQPHGRNRVPSVGRRISVILYALAYMVLVAAGIVAGLTIYQSLNAPNPQASYVTCRSGAKATYKQLGIRNPTSDANHDSLVIDLACRNLGGNTFTNVMRTGSKWLAWKYGVAIFIGGLVVIEVVKGALAYLITGYFPGPGALGRR